MPPDPALLTPALARLRAALPPLARYGRLPLGPAVLDAALGGGLALGALHAVTEGGETGLAASGAGTGFLASVLGRLAGPVLWISPPRDLFPAGLIRFGLDPVRLLLAAPESTEASLAAMETGLRAGVATVGEIVATGRLGGRRLALACLETGSTGFLLLRPVGMRPGQDGEPAAAFTRWRIAPAPSLGEHGEPGEPRWRLCLLAARGGGVGEWLVEPGGEDDAAPALRLASGLGGDAAGSRLRHAG